MCILLCKCKFQEQETDLKLRRAVTRGESSSSLGGVSRHISRGDSSSSVGGVSRHASAGEKASFGRHDSVHSVGDGSSRHESGGGGEGHLLKTVIVSRRCACVCVCVRERE